MSNIDTTELKLKTTPTGGADAAHSPYYRRLLSAGYKGFLQGTIGGASLYGAMGALIGVALAVAAAPATGMASLALIPAAAGIGVLKGASTFGNIGSVAAINAESADLSEQRRYLLDRYYELPEGPEGDREAEAIRRELVRNHDSASEAPPFFHWKTVAVCAVIGAAIGLTLMSPLGASLLAETALGHLFGAIGVHGALSAAGAGISALAGALTGAVIGVDRYYIRKWFDHTEGVVHSTSYNTSALRERHEQVERIKAASREDDKTKEVVLRENVNAASPSAPQGATPPQLDAAPSKPDTKVSQATLHSRMVDLQQAMEVPAL